MSIQANHLSSASVFDAAKIIAEALKDLPGAQQELALRFAAESVGLSSAAHHAPLPAMPALGTQIRDPDAAVQPVQDIRTYVRSRNPRTDTQLCAVVAYYYRFIAKEQDRKDTIAVTDLVEAIRLVGSWSQPKRPHLTLNNAKLAGYLDSAGSGSYRLNSVGENLVTMTLGGDGTSPSGPAAPKKIKSAKRTTSKLAASGKKKK